MMLQDVLATPERARHLKPEDRRGLTPLFWQHVQPYGEVRLDVAKRLPLGTADDRARPALVRQQGGLVRRGGDQCPVRPQ
ncbi:hypothetical protein ABZ297_28460 [Nonomuraea sp. NPDC005983]|uniref:hypothetical protein n=1 Tax=Nonomuraea sp. NPDC005983 TaxID=3155595 RepID=UPI0033A2F47E